MKNNLKKIGIIGCFLTSLTTFSQTNLTVDLDNEIAKIQPTMYGIFFEDINFAADGGIYAEMVKNRSFEFYSPKMGWIEPNSDRHSFNEQSGIARTIKYSDASGNSNYIQVTVNNDKGYELINEGFRGMGVKEGETYNLSVMAANESGDISAINFQLIGEDGKSLANTTV